MYSGIWFPRCGSDLTHGRVTTLEERSWGQLSASQEGGEGGTRRDVLDFLLDLDRRVDRELEVAHEHVQEDFDPAHPSPV